MNPLPKSEWLYELSQDGQFLAVGAHEIRGIIYWTKYALSDLPNDFVSVEDLEHIGIVGGADETAISEAE